MKIINARAAFYKMSISSRDQLWTLQCFWFRPCPTQFKSRRRHRGEYLERETHTDTDCVTELHVWNALISFMFLLHWDWVLEVLCVPCLHSLVFPSILCFILLSLFWYDALSFHLPPFDPTTNRITLHISLSLNLSFIRLFPLSLSPSSFCFMCICCSFVLD